MAPRRIGVVLAAVLLIQAGPAGARDVVDMSGRTVSLPDTIHRVYGAHSSSVALMAALAPDLLVGTYLPPGQRPDHLLPPVMAALPQVEVNGIMTMDLEKVMAADVDFALSLDSPGLVGPLRDRLAVIGKPVVAVAMERLADYPATFRFLGRVLGRDGRGAALAADIEARMAAVAVQVGAIAPADRPRVYYTESADGLHTQCDSANRAELIALAGGVNVVHCGTPNQMTSAPMLDAEHLIALDPQVIIARDPRAAARFLAEPRWQGLDAVRHQRVHAIPALPFHWFDRPPSFMRALGLQWLAATLHPGRVTFDMGDETTRFFALYFGVAPSAAAIADVLAVRGGEGMFVPKKP